MNPLNRKNWWSTAEGTIYLHDGQQRKLPERKEPNFYSVGCQTPRAGTLTPMSFLLRTRSAPFWMLPSLLTKGNQLEGILLSCGLMTWCYSLSFCELDLQCCTQADVNLAFLSLHLTFPTSLAKHNFVCPPQVLLVVGMRGSSCNRFPSV